ncbi:MAG: heparan-alpha-glucosaminide N-acetyltransferase [Candidatus Acetothermia bacterium]
MDQRLWGIDCFRGCAVLLMVLYHVLYDLDLFEIFTFKLYSPAWKLYAQIVAGTFFFLVGIGLHLSYQKATRRLTFPQRLRKYVLRGAKIIFLGVSISLATFSFFPQNYIIFGALHFIGFSVLLGYLIMEIHPGQTYGRPFAAIALSLIFAGFLLRDIRVEFSWLLWLGVRPSGFTTLDYFPILPWFGVILAGITFSSRNHHYQSNTMISTSEPPWIAKPLCAIGRHSLIIYLLHQPLLLGSLHLFLAFGSNSG